MYWDKENSFVLIRFHMHSAALILSTDGNDSWDQIHTNSSRKIRPPYWNSDLGP